jgi:hypothetical protein
MLVEKSELPGERKGGNPMVNSTRSRKSKVPRRSSATAPAPKSETVRYRLALLFMLIFIYLCVFALCLSNLALLEKLLSFLTTPLMLLLHYYFSHKTQR